jgi:hypothetical protein
MKNETEDFINYLLRLEVEHFDDDAKEELIYDINDIVLSLERLIKDFEEASKANDN